MALSELDMMNLWAKQLRGYKSQWERLFGFGYAIESEVRKENEALVQRMLDVLWEVQDAGPSGSGWRSDKLKKLLSDAEARLAPPPPTA